MRIGLYCIGSRNWTTGTFGTFPKLHGQESPHSILRYQEVKMVRPRAADISLASRALNVRQAALSGDGVDWGSQSEEGISGER
jgi:hypothetical protein